MTGIKINLNAIKNNGITKDGEVIDSIENKNTIIESSESNKSDDIILSGVKSLNSIPSGDEEEILENKVEEEKTEEKEEMVLEEKKDENILLLEEKKEELLLLEEKPKVEDENAMMVPKISLNNIKEVNVSENKKEAEEEKIVIIEEEKKELFTEYKSDFIKKGNFIFEKLKKLKNLPKTRFGALAILVFFVASIISGLFHFDPEHHNLNKYKTSILNIVGTKENNTQTNSGTNKEIKNTQTNSGSEVIGEANNTENFIGNKYEIKNVNGVEQFIYNGKVYVSKDEVIKAIKREKINDFLTK